MISVEDGMPKKTKTGKAQANPVVAEAITPGIASGRMRRPVLNPGPAKRKASPGLKSRSPRATKSLAAGSPVEPLKYPALVDAPAAPTAADSTPQNVRPARKGGAGKRTTVAAGMGGRSFAGKALPTRKHTNAADAAPQPQGSAESHSEQPPSADGNGHFDHGEVARLAYSYWEARGYQGGSPEDDWYRAQAELSRRKRQPEATKPRRRARRV